MTHHFKLFGLPAICLGLCLFLGWPFLLGVPVPGWLAILQWIAYPFILLALIALIALPGMHLLLGLGTAVTHLLRWR